MHAVSQKATMEDMLQWTPEEVWDAMNDVPNDCDLMEAGRLLDSELKNHMSSGRLQATITAMHKVAVQQTPEKLVQIAVGDTTEWVTADTAIKHACEHVTDVYHHLGRCVLTVAQQQQEIIQLKKALVELAANTDSAIKALKLDVRANERRDALVLPEICSYCFVQAPLNGFAENGGVLYCSQLCECASMDAAIDNF